MRTATIYALDYLAGFAVFGLIYYFLNGILVEMQSFAIDNVVYTYSNWIWTGAIVIYIIVGIFWLPRKIREWEGFR